MLADVYTSVIDMLEKITLIKLTQYYYHEIENDIETLMKKALEIMRESSWIDIMMKKFYNRLKEFQLFKIDYISESNGLVNKKTNTNGKDEDQSDNDDEENDHSDDENDNHDSDSDYNSETESESETETETESETETETETESESESDNDGSNSDSDYDSD